MLLSSYRGHHSELDGDNVAIWLIPFIIGAVSLLFSLSSRVVRRISMRASLGAAFSILLAFIEPTSFGRVAIALVYVIGATSVVFRYRKIVGADRDTSV